MASFPYTPNIPQATNQISQSQALLLQNFTSISSLIAVDHAPFPSGSAGWHNQVTFIQQSSDPSTSSTQFAMYNKGVGGGPTPTMFLRKPNNGAAIDFSTINFNIGQTEGTAGWSYLPSGIILKWGLLLYSSTNGTQTFNFAAGSPNFGVNGAFSITLTPRTSGTDLNVALYTDTLLTSTPSFTVHSYNRTSGGPSTNAYTFYYLAVGM